MSTKDFIKKSVLNAFTQYDAPKLAVALLAALALGALASVGVVALVSSWIALRYVTTMDASLALKEGE